MTVAVEIAALIAAIERDEMAAGAAAILDERQRRVVEGVLGQVT